MVFWDRELMLHLLIFTMSVVVIVSSQGDGLAGMRTCVIRMSDTQPSFVSSSGISYRHIPQLFQTSFVAGLHKGAKGKTDLGTNARVCLASF